MRNILRRPRTRAAIIATALAGSLVCGLVATAQADVNSPSTPAALSAPTAAAAASTCSNTYLAYGSRGTCVTHLQMLLGGLSLDGSYGSATRSRVRAFQTDARIGVDGKVGPQTWRKLRTYGRALATAGGITLYMCELPTKRYRVSAWNNTTKWANWAYYMSDHSYPLGGEKIGPNRLAAQSTVYPGSYNGTSFTAWVGTSTHHTRRVVDISPKAIPAC